MLVNIKVTGGLNIERGQIDPKVKSVDPQVSGIHPPGDHAWKTCDDQHILGHLRMDMRSRGAKEMNYSAIQHICWSYLF